MVGATNVGKIEVFLEGHQHGATVKVGDELGVFHFGSTVVTLMEKSLSSLPEVGQKVQFGQSLID
jgi:phosphatidylserine decarboxylase